MKNERLLTGKNTRSRERNAARRAIKRVAAEIRNAAFTALPTAEKNARNPNRKVKYA